MLSVSELFQKASVEMCGPVPWKTPVTENLSGVYVIALADPSVTIIENLPKAELVRWNAGEEIIYIGRATRLHRRIAQFYRHQYGRSSPHRGGEDILLVTASIQVYWATADNFADVENSMIEAFRSAVGALPFGNRVRAARKGNRWN